MNNQELIEKNIISIEDEMKRSYLDYAMSVIVSRAIPDVRDGLKPVHRRILYAMYESGCDFNKPFRKSARIVGEVMGKYHPHGDAAIYDSLVRMAQHFSLRLPLIQGQGNFGSLDGDPAAAMRYTESRLAEVAHVLLDDLDKDTVDFQSNYDESEKEPMVLPAKFPNILVNGSGGIAVGMATNIPPHNLGEVLDACCLYIDNPDIIVDDLLEIVQGPDFPTGGIILGRAGIRSGLTKGRGSIIIRGKTHFEDIGNRQAIIISEIPYQVNKSKMVEKIAELVKDKKIEGIADLRDESDKSGVRVVVEIKKDAIIDVVLSQLYSFAPLQTSFGVNTLALNNGKPELLNLLDIITSFVKHREEVVTKRTIFLLNKARDRAHILIGLSIAVANIDEVIKLIRGASDPGAAKDALLSRSWHSEHIKPLLKIVDNQQNIIEDDGNCKLTEIQVKAILEMRLQRLTGLEQEKINNELSDLAVEITEYLATLSSRTKLMNIIKDEFIVIKEKFATPRKTEINIHEFEHDIEDLIPKEDMVVTVTMSGYIKRVPLSTYRAQRRGGKGRSAVSMHDEDITNNIFVTNTHTPVLFFSNIGKVYKLKVYKLPLGKPNSKGRSLINIFPLAENEKINNVMPLPEDENLWADLNIMFATQNGNVRRNDLSDFHSVQSNGKIAIRLDEDDKLIGVMVCKPEDHILLASKQGKCVRFPVEAVRVFKSRTSDGVRGMRLAKEDQVISMSVLHGAAIDMEVREEYLRIPVEKRLAISTSEEQIELEDINLPYERIKQLAINEEFILTVTENGFGKRSSAYEYRITNRGGKGIVNIITSDRNGLVIDSFPVTKADQIILMSDKGTIIRTAIIDVRVTGRNTQGVLLFRKASDEHVVSATKIPETENNIDDNDQEQLDD